MNTKHILTLLISLTLGGYAVAETETTDSDAYKNAIMAFGISAEEAEKAADAAVSTIREKKAPSETDTANVFATVPDEIIQNPYGF